MLKLDKQKPRQLSGGTLGLKEEPPLSLFTSCLMGARRQLRKGAGDYPGAPLSASVEDP